MGDTQSRETCCVLLTFSIIILFIVIIFLLKHPPPSSSSQNNNAFNTPLSTFSVLYQLMKILDSTTFVVVDY